MPTGYTAGIIDGTIKTFEEFGKLCIRNFGAAIHMRDEPFSTPYKERTPSEYHLKEIAKKEAEIKRLESLSDADILAEEKSSIDEQVKQCKDGITKTKETERKLQDFLDKARTWEPPTEEHDNIKKFMIEQLESSIGFDGSTDFYEKELRELREKPTCEASIIRSEKIAQCTKSLSYHRDSHAKELKTCADVNLFVSRYFDSLKEVE